MQFIIIIIIILIINLGLASHVKFKKLKDTLDFKLLGTSCLEVIKIQIQVFKILYYHLTQTTWVRRIESVIIIIFKNIFI